MEPLVGFIVLYNKMVDIFPKGKRSYIMSRIKGKNTRIELAVRKKLWALGLKWYRIHSPKVLGNPDITFRKKKVAIFLDGDFWHGYVLKERAEKLPVYWLNKIERNMGRDRKYSEELRDQGWKVVRLWEHEITKNLDKAVAKIVKALG